MPPRKQHQEIAAVAQDLGVLEVPVHRIDRVVRVSAAVHAAIEAGVRDVRVRVLRPRVLAAAAVAIGPLHVPGLVQRTRIRRAGNGNRFLVGTYPILVRVRGHVPKGTGIGGVTTIEDQPRLFQLAIAQIEIQRRGTGESPVQADSSPHCALAVSG